MFRLVTTATVLFASLCSLLAQGGAGGYGQGSAGGGFGGGGMNRPAPGGGGGFSSGFNRQESGRKAKPDDSDDGYWETKSAILTPGDRVEFKFKLKKGETLMAAVTSDAFDPALSMEDGKGGVLHKNDDREEGDQSPFLIYRAPAEGEYVLKVLSYRSVSGGKFSIKMRTFLALDAPLGPKVLNLGKRPDAGDQRVMFRVACEKGHVYDLGRAMVQQGTTSQPISLMRAIGPTGVEDRDFQVIPTGDGSPVFYALATGDYYFEYYSYSGTQFITDFKDVQVVPAKSGSDAKLDFAPREIKVVEFPVTPGLIIRTSFSGIPINTGLSAPAGPEVVDRDFDPAWGTNRYWTWFKMNRDSDDDIVRIFNGDGKARIAIRSLSDSAGTLTFSNRESLPEWTTGQPEKGSLEIGGARLFLVKTSKSELMRVNAAADHFQPKLDIFRASGELANSLCDRKNHKAGDDLYFPDEGTFIVRLSCDGYGGSGAYAMARDVLTPQAYTMGKTQDLKLDGQNFGLYAVNLEAGKRYELMTDQPNNPIRADLLDSDGLFLVSNGLKFDKVEVQYFIPKKSGVHRLWLRGAPGQRQFKFQLHTAPEIKGL